ncbi:hypothetical protein [Pseudolactococcus paracarnosus]|uniref:Tandem five-TM protein n=1 Tax=Pseudolactococcus paracarnosus TaxID=2749962 RepID=A0ABT0AJH2_9LACT|nr:hypothetical protein [Lactococcus paracarnosus]MCJ1976683.1 hypothetical protein [Lactococcus paracarnosus]MCJ1982526.1 hypothetical protein [Lactococcus paracarnosus]MCJ1998747.1 hypothetical protein [Lactococcus paracarnosus]
MKKVDLLSEGGKSIIFDFIENRPYIEYFEIKGGNEEKTGYDYSHPNTFWLGLLLMSVTNVMGVFLDKILTINPIIGTIVSVGSAIFFIELILKFLKNKIIHNQKEYRVTKYDISRVLQQGTKKYWVLWLTDCLLVLGLVLAIIIIFSSNKMSGKDFIMINLLVSVVTFFQGTIHPNKVIKARRILKKQLKAGKYNE